MSQSSPVILATLLTLLWRAPADAASVFVPNHSFEEPIACCGSGAGGLETFTSPAANPTGWTVTFEQGTPGSPSFGNQDPAPAFYGSESPLPAPFDGNQFGFINLNNSGLGASLATIARADSSVLGTLQADNIFTLNVAVGARNSGSWANIEYSIGLVSATGSELGMFSFVTLDPGIPAVNNIADLPYTLDVGSQAAAFIGEEYFVRIRARNTGVSGTGSNPFAQANFDNVRLDVVPESSPLALAVCGAALWGALCLRRRRNR